MHEPDDDPGPRRPAPLASHRRVLRRWIILATTFLAVASLLAFLEHRRQSYLRRLAYHNDQELVFSLPKTFPEQQAEMSEIARRLGVAPTSTQVTAELGRRSAYRARRAAYHSALKSKYEAVVSRPWMVVPPDPPEP